MIKILFQLFLWMFPWRIRRLLLQCFFKFQIHPSSHIGLSVILARSVVLEENAVIGSFTFCKTIDSLLMRKNAKIGNFNFITGIPTKTNGTKHFAHIINRKCELEIGVDTRITSRHYFDCTAGIYFGNFCQVAGYGSTFLTHSIDLANARQDAAPIRIGSYCFLGIKSTYLMGITISDNIIVGACSLVNKSLTESDAIYGGVPAKFKTSVTDCKFFVRTNGQID